MTFREYLESINQLAKDHPEALDFTVITARDEEGNGFEEVQFDPTVGFWDDDGGFHREEDNEEPPDDEYNVSKEDYNAVCLN